LGQRHLGVGDAQQIIKQQQILRVGISQHRLAHSVDPLRVLDDEQRRCSTGQRRGIDKGGQPAPPRIRVDLDGKYMAVGAIEPQFYAQLLAGLGLSADDVPNQLDTAAFPEVHKLFAQKFASKTRDKWTEIFAGTDACVTPVLTWREAAQNEHLRARSTLVTANGVDQAAPAPRFSRTPPGPVGAPPQTTTPLDEINW
jgi:crotonobetainyl-CoA:carnitine CoA-transferase CaiB-like acyl-CoA transferase